MREINFLQDKNILLSEKVKKISNFRVFVSNEFYSIKINNNCNINNLSVYMSKNSELIIDDNCSISGEFRIGLNSKIHIKKNTTVASNLHITAYESTKVHIGEDCMFSHNVIIRTSDGHYIYDNNGGGTELIILNLYL